MYLCEYYIYNNALVRALLTVRITELYLWNGDWTGKEQAYFAMFMDFLHSCF